MCVYVCVCVCVMLLFVCVRAPLRHHLIFPFSPFTHSAAAFIVVGAAAGEMAFPLIVGNLFNTSIGPLSMMWVMFLGCSAASLLFVFLWVFGMTGSSHYDRKDVRHKGINGEGVEGGKKKKKKDKKSVVWSISFF